MSSCLDFGTEKLPYHLADGLVNEGESGQPLHTVLTSSPPYAKKNLMTEDDPLEIPIDGVLDLHTFSPKDVKDLVPEYIEECLKREIFELRIIHGKGTGTLKGIVHGLLEKNPHVAGFEDAEAMAGGWGATLVRLRRP
jgi:DNA-nicking Smr family endonuclease